VTQFSGRNEAVAVLVEDLEGLLNLFLRVGVLHLARHHGQEFGKVNRAVAVGVDLLDHILELVLSRILAFGRKNANY
jgi:hypothetical protein